MNPAQTKLVNDLFTAFSADWPSGALEARLRWYLLDDEIVGAVRSWAITEVGGSAIQQQVDVAMGVLGIFGRANAGNQRANTVSAFAQLIVTLRESRGDPPIAAALRARALEVATGRVGPQQALQLLASEQPQAAALLGAWIALIGANPIMAAVLGKVAQYLGVLAIPREQLHEFYASLHADRPAGFRAAFQLALAEAQVRMPENASAAHALAEEAFRLAVRTPEPDDDLQAIRVLLQLPAEVLTAQDVLESTTRLLELVRATGTPGGAAEVLSAIRSAAYPTQTTAQVFPLLAETAKRLLDGDLSRAAWGCVATDAVELALRAGNPDLAEAVVARYKQRAADDAERSQAQVLDAEVRWFRGEKVGAVALLEKLCEATPEDGRFIVALRIVQMWPSGRAGRERWVDICNAGLTRIPDAGAFIVPLILSITARDWGTEPVAALLESLDVQRLRAGMSPGMRKSFDEAMQPFESFRPNAGLAGPPRTPTGSVLADAFPAVVMQALRQRLLADVAKGTVVGPRGVELGVLLQDLEALLALPSNTLQEVQAKVARSKDLMARVAVFLSTPSHQRPLPPSGSLRDRARMQLRALLGIVVKELSLPLQSEGEREVEHDLMRRAFQLDTGLVEAASDEEGAGFWPSIRRLAIEVGIHARRGHLVLARPIFSGPLASLDVSAVYFSGSEPVRALLAAACARRGLSLSTAGGAGPAASDRWSRIGSAAVAMFDLSVPPGPELAAVCYELGIALALGMAAVPIKAPGGPPPFDVDLKPTELPSDAGTLLDALEAALFEPSRGEPGDLAATFRALESELGDRGQSGTLKVALDQARAVVDDPVKFRTAVGTVLGLWGPSAPQALLPAWPASYPDKPRCFHVMPFGAPWSDEVTRVVEEACRGRAEYDRGDRDRDPNVLRRIWSDLGRATHVLVDLTGFNANVALELGLAHVLGRRTMIVGQGDTVERLFPAIAKLHVYRYAGKPDWQDLRRLVLKHLN